MRQVRARLNERGVYQIGTPSAGGNQKTSFINEPNLYRCILKSDKPEAKKFEDWIVEEVLPQIRKTGEYKPDFETALTTVKQHTRKLPTQRVKKEIVLSERGYEELIKRIEDKFNASKVLSILGGVVKNCVKFEMDKSIQAILQLQLDFNKLDLPTVQKKNMQIFKDMNTKISEYGKICEIAGKMQLIVSLERLIPTNLFNQVKKYLTLNR